MLALRPLTAKHCVVRIDGFNGAQILNVEACRIEGSGCSTRFWGSRHALNFIWLFLTVLASRFHSMSDILPTSILFCQVAKFQASSHPIADQRGRRFCQSLIICSEHIFIEQLNGIPRQILDRLSSEPKVTGDSFGGGGHSTNKLAQLQSFTI